MKEGRFYILIGSGTLKDRAVKNLHSGAGRISFVDMKPMALFESQDSNGSISLRRIIGGNLDISELTGDIDCQRLAYLTCRGGWPSSIALKEKLALNVVKEHINIICEFDISRMDGVRRNRILARQILRA